MSIRNEADTARVVVLQGVIEGKTVHSPISVGAQKVSLVNWFTKSEDAGVLENLVTPRLLRGPKQLVHMGRSLCIRP